jgi:hypothetical protein
MPEDSHCYCSFTTTKEVQQCVMPHKDANYHPLYSAYADLITRHPDTWRIHLNLPRSTGNEHLPQNHSCLLHIKRKQHPDLDGNWLHAAK